MDNEKNDEQIKNDLNEVTNAINNLISNTDEFLKEIVSFLKWTTAFSFAALAWFATQLKIENNLDFWFGGVGLVFIVLSIMISIYTIKQIIVYLELTWKTRTPYDLLRICLSGNLERNPILKGYDSKSLVPLFVDTLLTESKDSAQKRNEWLEKFKPKLSITLHLVCLLLGLIFYSLTLFV